MIPRIARDIFTHLESDGGVVPLQDREEAELDVAAVLIVYRDTEDEIAQMLREEARTLDLHGKRLENFATALRVQRNQARNCEELATAMLVAIRSSQRLDAREAADDVLHRIIVDRLHVFFPDPADHDPDSGPDLPPAAQGRLLG